MSIDYCKRKYAVFGVSAQNREQSDALEVLMDPSKELVIIEGMAGTGKTMLALAAGLEQTYQREGTYRKVVFTRELIPIGKDPGFLPGTEADKMSAWLGCISDNLEQLQHPGMGAIDELLEGVCLAYMRGRSFVHKYVIIDEAQNLRLEQLQDLITRCGMGSKFVLLGDNSQKDITHKSGLEDIKTYMRDLNRPYYAEVVLKVGERSRLATDMARMRQ